MKKKFLLVAFATIAAAIVVAGYYDRSQTDGLTPMQIANIESLSATDPEIFIDYDTKCIDGGVDMCVLNGQVVLFGVTRSKD